MNRYEKRLQKLRTLIGDAGVDAFYVTGVANVAYFTGKAGNDCSLYITQDKTYIITDFRYMEMAQALDWLELVEIKNSFTTIDIINSLPGKLLGVEEEHLPLSLWLKFNAKVGKELKPLTGLVESLRQIKDEQEIADIKRACEIACKGFMHMLDFLKPGLSEKQCVAELEYFIKSSGAEDMSFSTILISGKNTSLPHGVPGDRIIQKGDFVTMDFGCKFNGYCSDMTRTVAIGNVTDEMKKVYNTVLEAQLAACDGIKAGITGAEAHKIASDIIDKAGYSEYFGHGLGHAVGLEIHESPRYSPLWKDPIPENTVLSIEPGIYLPGKFGVRIEDLALVTKTGTINFMDVPKELLII